MLSGAVVSEGSAGLDVQDGGSQGWSLMPLLRGVWWLGRGDPQAGGPKSPEGLFSPKSGP